MKNKIKHSPPKWATKFLHWYCSNNMLEDLEGDLNEYYNRNVDIKGKSYANWNYIFDVLKFFRLYTVQPNKINPPMNQLLLFKNYFNTSIRSLGKNRLFTIINIMGLAISMSVGLLLIVFISEVYSYDNFHKDANRIYRTNSSYQYLGEPQDAHYASTTPLLAKKLQSSIAGIENLTIICRSFATDLTFKDKTLPVQYLWASEEFFDIFSFELLNGDPSTALVELNSIIVTDEMAIKLFGHTDVLNKQVTLDQEVYNITGVVANPPLNSHIQFEALASYCTLENRNKDNKYYLSWTNMWNHYIYFKVKEDQDAKNIQSAINQICEEENDKIENVVIFAHMQPLLGIMPGEDVYNNIGGALETKYVWVLVLLAVIVILLACFNYTNLSLGRSFKRSMEIGIRKVNGANGFHVWLQFIIESTILALFALVIALGLFMLLKDYFFIIDRWMKEIVTLDLTFVHIAYFLAFAILVGIMAGFFPAFIFSRVNVNAIFKNLGNKPLKGRLTIRKALIFVQYMISVAFIVAVSLIQKQYEYSLHFDLGFNTENIINISVNNEGALPFINNLKQIPEITSISQSSSITSLGGYSSSTMKYTDPMDSADVYRNVIDANYLPLHGHQFVAGKNFLRSKGDSVIDDRIIVNEAFLKRFNMGSAQEAIGEEIWVAKKKKVIHGVLRDFHYGTMYHKIGPFAFFYSNKALNNVILKVSSSNHEIVMDKIEIAWEKFDNVHPLNASYYTEQIKDAYGDQASDVAIVSVMAILAIFIASMGLLGMVVFTTESRLKEISIRKVFGAREIGLIYVLGKNFMVLLLLAAVIAIPVTYYFVNTVIFSELVYKTTFNVMDIMKGVLIVIAIALLVVAFETLKAAKTNPATTLRNE